MPTPTITVQSDAMGTVISTVPPTGQATSANSLPVVVASDQGAVPVSAAALPLPTGAATAAKQDADTAAIVATGPGTDAFAITTSDSANFTTNARSIYVGGAGDVTIVTPANTVVTFKAVPVGSILPVQAKRVNATATTASNLVGLI